MSDRLAVMNEGRIEHVGTPADVYQRPGTRFVASFIGRSNMLSCTVERQDGGVVARCSDGVTVPVPAGTATGPALLSVRYESVSLRSGATGPGISAVVEEVVFVGDAVELVGRIGTTVLVARHPGQSALGVQRGDVVKLVIDPDGAVVLRD